MTNKDQTIKELQAKIKARDLVIDTLRGLLFTGWQLTTNYERTEEDDHSDPAPNEPCKGFRWIGQSFASCDECGLPYWKHECVCQIRQESGPFDDDPFEYAPISDESKAAVKAKWEGR